MIRPPGMAMNNLSFNPTSIINDQPNNLNILSYPNIGPPANNSIGVNQDKWGSSNGRSSNSFQNISNIPLPGNLILYINYYIYPLNIL